MDILLFVVVLVLLIVVHEFGHFIVAKRSGIRVDEFGIFFGPKLFGKKFGETEYTLNLWPIGGFVKIFGENPEDVSEDHPDKERSLVGKSKLTQAAVLFAGVFFNMIIAWLLFSAAFALGMPTPERDDLSRPLQNPELTITEVLEGSPAHIEGITQGDAIVGIIADEAELVELSPEAATAFISSHANEVLTFSLVRNGESVESTLIPAMGVIEGSPEQAAVGIRMGVVGTLVLPIHLALWEGLTLTIDLLGRVTVAIVGFLASALAFQADLSEVAGPVGIVGLVGDAASLGLVSLITFTAFISINLAIINLIPVPALDGGRLLFLLIEAIKGSPIRPAVANALNTVGFVFLIFLMIAVTYNDVLRILG